MVGTAVAMFVIYLVFAVWYLARVGEVAAVEGVGLAEGTTWASYLMAQVLNALNFGVGVAVLLLGWRTIIGEIVPAFAGIAERVVPNALPALDCPVSFPYAPNAVLIGFLASVVGGLVSLGVLTVFQSSLALALILPGMVPHFFTGGSAGGFGNAPGGGGGGCRFRLVRDPHRQRREQPPDIGPDRRLGRGPRRGRDPHRLRFLVPAALRREQLVPGRPGHA